MVIGQSEAGKTSLVTALAVALAAGGLAVAVVDADVGQSEIGPPGTVGLGRAVGAMTRLGDAQPVALSFVGATSPAREMTAVVRGTERLVGRARALDAARILVDTSGLVAGDFGRALKRRKIDAVKPDLLIALQTSAECEHILAAYAGRERPAIVRMPALVQPRRRSDVDRRRHRTAALAAYMTKARPLTLDTRRVSVRSVRGEPLSGEGILGALVGIEDEAGDVLGVGVVRDFDAGASMLTVNTPLAGGAVAGILVGQERVA
jgi:polynucleotide 5'-hydroxyl-kinase GRC3/NOL9